MTVLNQIDRFDLAMDVIDRVPRLQATSGPVRERLRNKLIEHRMYVREHGEDMPEITGWEWQPAPGPAVTTAAPERNAPEG
jgi:xylulose-5-phosphate/fructose-6-phosphate phosphoketolase